MHIKTLTLAGAALFASGTNALAGPPSKEAVEFGTREAVEQISLSPDGAQVAFIAPGKGRSAALFVAPIGGAPHQVLGSSGAPERLKSCGWVSTSRLVCTVMLIGDANGQRVGFTRMVAVGADGKDVKLLSADTTSRALGVAQFGGEVIDWLPETDGSVLMTRNFIPESTKNTHLANEHQGYGVERVDVATLRRTTVEQPKPDAAEYLADGHGDIRILGQMASDSSGYLNKAIHYFYRTRDSREWQSLSVYDTQADTGFEPYAVDRDLNVVYGFEREGDHNALYSISLDGKLTRTRIYQRSDVDLDGLIEIGRQHRVVGVSYVTDRREAIFFDPKLKALADALSKALPGLPLIRFVDASTDENKLLLWAGSDVDPGRYYVFDRTTKQLNEIMLSRPPLEHAALAPVKAVSFPAADGTSIPGYLTLPPGSNGKGLPAIVMPHGGPGARDEWGFDWLAQFFAARGYAVLQPNFRGSTGYGDAWFRKNGFQSWRTAIGDVDDGGRWLVSQGIADPKKLAIVGWSYGGYAALQSGVLDPGLFKAIVAIAPVSDLQRLKDDARAYTNYKLVRDFVGNGPQLVEGSPARNADRIQAPVLMFHGDQDQNVDIGQSREMQDRLRDAGKPVDLVTFPGLDHYLEDGDARVRMLDSADQFLRTNLGK